MIKIHLFDLLQSKGWTQRDLAKKISVREATISNMCNNCIPRINIKHLSSICEVMNCKVEDVLEYVPD